MNAGTDYLKALAHAQANADQSGYAWCVFGYGGSWWIERQCRDVTFGRMEVVPPTPKRTQDDRDD